MLAWSLRASPSSCISLLSDIMFGEACSYSMSFHAADWKLRLHKGIEYHALSFLQCHCALNVECHNTLCRSHVVAPFQCST